MSYNIYSYNIVLQYNLIKRVNIHFKHKHSQTHHILKIL